MGMTKDMLQGLKETRKVGEYTIATPPSPHSAFSEYTLTIGYKSGLCKIRAEGRNDNQYDEKRSIEIYFEKILNSLTSKYGKPGYTSTEIHLGKVRISHMAREHLLVTH